MLTGRTRVVRLVCLAMTAVLLACASPVPTPSARSAEPSTSALAPVAKKRITVAVRATGPVLWGGTGSGPEWVIDLFTSAPIAFDPPGDPVALLAESVPSIERGTWKLLPDGRMETTTTIRRGAAWHDGVPLSADDLIFGAAVGREIPELQLSVNFGSALYTNLERLEAVDERTVVAHWNRPVGQADWLFSYLFAPPLPKHLLGESFAADKAGFPNLRYFSTDFIGNGPFVVREFTPASRLELTANDAYVLGRPKLDEIQVLYIPDANTMIANLLAVAVDLTLGQGLSIDQATRAQESWPNGAVITSPFFLTQAVAYPQFVNPDPPLLTNLQFRRALAHATDRNLLVETIQAGIGSPSSALIAPTGPDFDAVRPRVVDYPYDPRRAAQMIDDLGVSRGADNMYRDAAGKPLTVALWAAAGDDVYERTTLAVADMWQRLGVATEQNRVPGSADRAVMPSRPGFQMAALRTEVDTRFLSTEVPLPENSFRGANRARYASPVLDTFLNRYFTTVAKAERTAALGDIVHHLGDQVVVIHLFYNAVPQMVNQRLLNVTPRTSRTNAYQSYLWDVSS